MGWFDVVRGGRSALIENHRKNSGTCAWLRPTCAQLGGSLGGRDETLFRIPTIAEISAALCQAEA